MRDNKLVKAACVAAGAIGLSAMTCSADTFSIDVDGLEGVYGGFVGDFDKETTYDFGMAFASVDAAVLSLSGQTDIPGSQLTFIPELDGAASLPTVILSPGTFDVTLDLVVGPGALDGAGDIALLLDTFSSMGADFSSGVNEAVLTFVGLPATFTGCGILVPGPECVLFQTLGGDLYILDNLGPYGVGALVEVTGTVDPNCITTCQAGDGCILDNTITACCLGDTDGDGVVGIDDLVNVVLCFGTNGIDCPAAGINSDVNMDGIVDVDDIVIVVLNFGPCPAPLGRCCFDGIVPPQLCQVTTELECTFFVNSEWTPDIGCDVPCEPIGRCCLPNAPAGAVNCQDVEESVCFALGGKWDGDLTCATPCTEPLGRCCFNGIVPPQLCAETTEAECMTFNGGVWTAGLDCKTPCEPDGQCCYVEGGEQLCVDTPESACVALFDGQWNEELTCNNACTGPLGRCCFVGIVPPLLCAVTTEAECMMFIGGVWTAGLDCSTPCEPDGQCCYIDAAGNQLCVDTPESACLAVFQGQWNEELTCNNACTGPLGRCCFVGIVPPLLCAETTEAECMEFVGGQWTAGLDCSTPCEPEGRCCYVVGGVQQCVETTQAACLINFSGDWFEGATCDMPCDEPAGRCCFVGIIPPAICEVTTEAACEGFIESTWTEGLTCDDPCEPDGRCCYIDAAGAQQCVVNVESACFVFFNGTWTEGLTCATPCFDTCPALCGPAFDCVQGCGVLVQGVECVLFDADAGGLYVLSDLGGFSVGDRVEVAGCFDPNCDTICQQGNGCILNFSIVACPEPLGRCCFDGIVPPQLCEVTTELECGFFVNSTWTAGLDCSTPCGPKGGAGR